MSSGGDDSSANDAGFNGLTPPAQYAIMATVAVVGLVAVSAFRRRWRARNRRVYGESRHEEVVVYLDEENPPPASPAAVGRGRRTDPLTDRNGARSILVTEKVVKDALKKVGDNPKPGEHKYHTEGEGEACSICLEELSGHKKSEVFVAPRCKHEFHLNCVSKWVYTSSDISCPLCKAQFLPETENGSAMEKLVRRRESTPDQGLEASPPARNEPMPIAVPATRPEPVPAARPEPMPAARPEAMQMAQTDPMPVVVTVA